MKKTIALLLALMMVFALCISQTAFADEYGAPDYYDTLRLEFVPSTDAETILNATAYLPEILKAEMAERGYTVNDVVITVGESYDATGAALAAGDIDVAWLPAGTFAAYIDDVNVLVEATRQGLSNKSTDPISWNGSENKTLLTEEEVGSYYALIMAGPSEYGRQLAAKIANGETLSWEELDAAVWAVQRTSSSAGYIYPSKWLMDNYGGMRISDLSNVIPLDGYRQAFELAAEEKVDVVLAFADARIDYEALWTMSADSADSNGIPGMGRENPIWDELQVLAVTEAIPNDTVSISRNSEFYTPFVAIAIQDSLMAIIDTEVGKTIFSPYDHDGYIPGSINDYMGVVDVLDVVVHADEADIIELPDSEEGDGETVDTAGLRLR